MNSSFEVESHFPWVPEESGSTIIPEITETLRGSIECTYYEKVSSAVLKYNTIFYIIESLSQQRLKLFLSKNANTRYHKFAFSYER